MAKKTEKTEDKMIKFNKTTFSTLGLSGMTKEEFVATHEGKIDMKGALKVVSKYLKK